MRTRFALLGGGVAFSALLAVASPAAAVDTVALPFVVPRGAHIEVMVDACTMPGSVSAVARLGPTGQAPAVEVSGALDGGGGVLVARIPIDAVLGEWTSSVTCLDSGGTAIDGPATSVFTVAAFTLLTVDPATGPAGSTVTVSGTGCPVGTTDSVWAKSAGASDNPIPLWDPSDTGTSLAYQLGSFSGPLQIPIDAPEGENTIWVYCVSEGGSALAGPIVGVFLVDNSLPPTGAASTGLTAAGLALVLTGLLLAVPARCLRRSAR